MKKVEGVLVGLLILALAACSGGATTSGVSTGQAASSTAAAGSFSSEASSQWGILNTSYSDALAVPVQLAVGTMQLDGTENAVTAEQAGELLTLWQGYSSLLSGGYAAQEEYDGLQHQIEETLTAAQLQSIAKLQLTVDDMGSVMAEMGPVPEARPARTSAGSSSSSSSSTGGMPMSGGADVMMIGGPPGGMESTTTADGDAASSAPASLQATGDINPQLVQAVIAYLQGKLNPAPGN